MTDAIALVNRLVMLGETALQRGKGPFSLKIVPLAKGVHLRLWAVEEHSPKSKRPPLTERPCIEALLSGLAHQLQTGEEICDLNCGRFRSV